MEYLPFGSLQNHLSLDSTKPVLNERECSEIVSQILEGLRFMHENDFAHRDLKPAVRVLRSTSLLYREHATTDLAHRISSSNPVHLGHGG
jgi:serine/threonine protein kinase